MICSVDADMAIQNLLTAIAADRLVVVCGAGLSMAPPSNLPSAATLAHTARDEHLAVIGPSGAVLPIALEDQATYFYERRDLEKYFVRHLVPRDAFSAPPNAAHFAVADLLLCKAASAAVSANVDTLIETAGNFLFGKIEVALSGSQASLICSSASPLLKIHGCWCTDQANTVWTPKQLEEEPIKTRIYESGAWLKQYLRDKDLLVVGFWSDWSYLNAVLGVALGAVYPSRVTIVDLAETEELSKKAPQLCALGEGSVADYRHVQVSGADFLESLRIAFSRSFYRKALHRAVSAYNDVKGAQPAPDWIEPPILGVQDLYAVRRDIEGRKPNEPARAKSPDHVGPLLGLIILLLRARGAVSAGAYWRLDNKTIRVIWSQGDLIHNVKKDYERETSALNAADIVICVGAVDLFVPSNIVRGSSKPNIARGGPPGDWLTHEQAKEEFDL